MLCCRRKNVRVSPGWACAMAALPVMLLAGCVGSVEPLGGPVVVDGAVAAPDAGPPAVDGATPSPDAAVGAPDGATVDATATSELLTVQFDTTANGGNYAPRNIVAVWVTSTAGTFQKTLGRWADTRVSHLVAWGQASGVDNDAVSGATRPAHTPRLAVTWDLKNKAGQIVPDGTYTIRMELADSNASQPAQNHQGTFTFIKNGVAATQTVTGGGFLNVSINYSGR